MKQHKLSLHILSDLLRLLFYGGLLMRGRRLPELEKNAGQDFSESGFQLCTVQDISHIFDSRFLKHSYSLLPPEELLTHLCDTEGHFYRWHQAPQAPIFTLDYSSSTVGRARALHSANLELIPSIPYIWFLELQGLLITKPGATPVHQQVWQHIHTHTPKKPEKN